MNEVKILPFHSLPKLPVFRDAYCDMQTVDRVCEYLQKENQGILIKLLFEEVVIRQANYFKVLTNLFGFLVSQEVVQVPKSPLGQIDLLYEISRRLRKAYELPDIPPQGKPFAQDIVGPFPHLMSLEISKTSSEKGITQEVVDTVISIFYELYPSYCFLIGEAMRRNVIACSFGEEKSQFIREIIIREGFAHDEKSHLLRRGAYQVFVVPVSGSWVAVCARCVI